METNFEALQAFIEQFCWLPANATAFSLLQHSLANASQSSLAEQSTAGLCSGLFAFCLKCQVRSFVQHSFVMSFLLLGIRCHQTLFMCFSKQPLETTNEFTDFHGVLSSGIEMQNFLHV